MAVNDSEKKADAISEKRVEKGEELQQFQEAQGELFNIQAEQRNNLNQQRTVSGMEAQNNQTLAQAAEILAASGGVAGGAAMAMPQVNRGTQGILKKYGLKPGSTTKTQTNTQQSQSPQRVSVTNNTTTNTTNNIQMAPPNIPMAAPVIPIRAGAGGSDTERFKVWVSNAFAKQNEAAAIREKEYNKREWSLTRSANKMIRKMGEIGKSIGDTMNPKNLVSTMNNQFKVLMFLMGFQFLSKNIKGILEGIDRFVYWITDGSYGGSEKYAKGKDWKKISETFKNIIGGDFFDSFKDIFSDGITRLTDEIKLIFEDRGRAIKAIEFPKIDLGGEEGIIGTIKGIGQYLGDVISTAFTGTEGLVKQGLRNFKSSGRAKSLENYEDKYSHTQDIGSGLDVDYTSRRGISMSDVSIGDAVTSAKGFKDNYKMAASDFNSFGGLSNNTGSSVKQSGHIMNMLDKAMETGQAVDISQLTAGLSTLSNTAKRHGGTLVSIDFMQKLGQYFGLPREVYLRIIQKMKTTKVRYVIIPKSDAELSSENTGSFGSAAISRYAQSRMIGSVSNTAANVSRMSQNFSKGNYGEEVSNIATSLVSGSTLVGATAGSFLGPVGTVIGAMGGAAWDYFFHDNSESSAVVAGLHNKVRGLAHDGYTVKMVELGDPRYEKYETLYTKDGKVYTDQFNNTYLILTPAIIRDLETAIKAQHGVDMKFDADNVETARLLHKVFNSNPDGSMINEGSGMDEFEKSMRTVTELENMRDEARADMNFRHSQDSISKAVNTSNNSYAHIDNPEVYNKAKTITETQIKDNASYIMSRLINDPELNLTPEQAAGLVGNLYEESGLIPGRHNPNDLGMPASGIAQWRNERREKYKEIYGKYPNEDKNLVHEVDYLISELKGTEKDALKAVKEMSNLIDTTHTWMVKFERPKDQEYNGKNHQRRFNHALRILKTYNNDSGVKNYEYKYKPESTEVVGEKNNRTAQDILALKFSPTAGKKNIKEVDIENSDSINPLADAMTIYGDMDTFAANHLKGAEKAWYEMYRGKSRDELEKEFNEEGILEPKAITSQAAQIDGLLADKIDYNGNATNSPLAVIWQGTTNKERKTNIAEMNNLIKEGGFSSLYTKYLKEKYYHKDPNKSNVDKIGRILLGDKYNGISSLDEFVKEYLENSSTPTLSSSIYYHTTPEQREMLHNLFFPGGIYKGTVDDINRWEDAHLGRAKIGEITKDRYNLGVKNARINWLNERVAQLTEEKKEEYLKEYITANLKGNDSLKNKDNEYNLSSISKVVDNLQKSWVDKKRTLYKSEEDLIRETLGVPEGKLSDAQIMEGFSKLSEILKSGTYDERLKISKNIISANKLHEMSQGIEELENKSGTETMDYLKNLVLNNKNDKAYLMTRLGITNDEYGNRTLNSLINGLQSEDSKKQKYAEEILRNTKLYSEAKETLDNYYAGTIAQARSLVDVTKDISGDVTQIASQELSRLSSVQRVNINDTGQFKLLNDMGKKISEKDLPNIELDQVSLAKSQEETLQLILRNLIINGYYEKVLAETNYDLLQVDLANLNKDTTVYTVSNSESKASPMTQGT